MYRHFFAWIEMVQEGRKPLSRCDLCGTHMPAGRLLKHQRTKRCDQNMQMRWRRMDVAIVSQCEGEAFILTVEDNSKYIEGVDTFKYLWRILDRSDDDWPAVLRNVRNACGVWIRLGKLFRREGAEPRVSAMFYQEVVQAVLLFGAETWILSEALSRNLEGVHVGFLRHIAEQRAM